MSFLAPKPPGQMDSAASRQSYDFTGGLPVPYGRVRLGLKYIETPWNYRAESSGSKSAEWIAYSLAGVLCHGPVDALLGWYINGKPGHLSGGGIYRDAEDYVDQYWGYAGGGSALGFRLYWGTDTQAAHPLLAGNSMVWTQANQSASANGQVLTIGRGEEQYTLNPAPNIHPAYRGICYVVFWRLLTDYPASEPTGQSSIPPIEFVLYRRNPVASFHFSADSAWTGVSPVGILHDLLTNRRTGLGLGGGFVDSTLWADAAGELARDGFHTMDGGHASVSAAITARESTDAVMSRILSLFDGFVGVHGGTITPGWFPNRPLSVSAIAALPLLERNDLSEIASIEWPDTDGLLTSVSVSYQDPGEHMEKVRVTATLPVGAAMRAESASEDVDADGYRTEAQARALAARMLSGRQGATLKLSVFRRAARHSDGSPLSPGDLFRYNDADAELEFVARVEQTEILDALRIRIIARQEPGSFNDGFEVAPDDRALPPSVDPVPFQLWRAVEIPPSLSGVPWPPQVALLAHRAGSGVLTAEVWESDSGAFGGEERLAHTFSSFASAGELPAGCEYDDSQLELHFSGVGPPDYSAAEILDRHGLLFAGDEIMALRGRVSADGVGGFVYDVERGCFGTDSIPHQPGTPVYFIPRAAVPVVSAPVSGTRHYALIARTLFDSGVASDPIAVTVRDPAATVVWSPAPNAGAWDSVVSGRSLALDFAITAGSRLIRRWWLALHYSDAASMPGSTGAATGERVIDQRAYPSGIAAADGHVSVKLTRLGWHAITLYVEDERGGEYIDAHTGWVYCAAPPAPSGAEASTDTLARIYLSWDPQPELQTHIQYWIAGTTDYQWLYVSRGESSVGFPVDEPGAYLFRLWHLTDDRVYSGETYLDNGGSGFLARVPGPENCGFIMAYTAGGDDRESRLVLPSDVRRYQFGSNQELELPGEIDTIEAVVRHDWAQTQVVEEWPTHGWRAVSTHGHTEWTVFRFKSWNSAPTAPAYYEGKSRLVIGVNDHLGDPLWQNLDGGDFLSPIGPTAVSIYSLHAERVTGSGGYLVGTMNWGTNNIESRGGGSQSGWASLQFVEETFRAPLYIAVPVGTVYRFSFLLLHRPD